MTPEWSIVWTAVAGGVGAYIGAYLQKKAQNLATKEDIGEITRVQEEITSELATRSHFGRLRYEREFEIYRDVWRDLCAFTEPTVDWGQRTDEAAEIAAFEVWQRAGRKLFDTIRDNKPFYPAEVEAELRKFQILCDVHRIRQSHLNRQSLPEMYKARDQTLEEVKAQLQPIEQVIRDRLNKFD